MQRIFTELLLHRWQASNSLLCVGLDPDPAQIPEVFAHNKVFEFCQQVIDAAAPYVCAFKPQIAYFAAYALEPVLEQLIAYIHQRYPDIPVILDAKRGDVANTAQMYAREAFERYRADAVTVNPWLGYDSVVPYLEYREKGVIVLCRTSNPGSAELQGLTVDGLPLYLRVAKQVAQKWNSNANCCLVVGATFPNELKVVRQIVGDMPILVPGIGAQGGDVAAVLAAGKTKNNDGLIISSSRNILYPWYSHRGSKVAQAGPPPVGLDTAQIRIAAQQTRDLINQYR